MIQVNEITKEFKQGKEDKKVLDKVSFEVPNGSIAGLIGRKGSGKTVATRIITGIQNPSHGKVLLDGKDIMVDTLEARLAFGYVPADTEQFQGLTGEQYLNFISDVYAIRSDDRRKFMDAYADKLKVELELKHRMSTYSKSMYRKMMLLGAMLYKPNNLILDGFFENLDGKDTDSVKTVLKEYAAAGHSVMITDSRLNMVEKLCDRVIVLVGGKVSFDGSLVSLKEKYGETANLDMIDLMIHKETKDLFKDGEEEVVVEEKKGRKEIPWSKLFDRL